MNKPYKTSMIRILSVFLGLLLLCSNINYAQTFKFETTEASGILSGNDLNTHHFPDTITVWCNDWDFIQDNLTHWGDSMKLKSNNAFVKFYADHYDSSTRYMTPVSYNYWLAYRIHGYKNPADTVSPGGITINDDTLAIGYNNTADNSPYQELSLKKYSNFYKVMIEITGIYENVGGSLSSISSTSLTDPAKRNFKIEGSILTQHYDKRYYGINAGPPFIAATGTHNPDEITLLWAFLPSGAALSPLSPRITPANYELEWTYVDDYDVNISTATVSHKPLSSLSYNFSHNSTRVMLDTNAYSIPYCYSSGYVVFRVRAIRPDSLLFKFPVYGAWSLPDSGVLSALSPVNSYGLTNVPFSGDSLNWQYSVNFAEKGKSKYVASFYDGLLKNRQSITRINSNPDMVIVTNNVYDYEGRLSIKTLPAPIYSSLFAYQHDVDLNDLTNLPYKAQDFDSGFSICPAVSHPIPLAPTALARIYYSPNNPHQSGMQQFVPDAVGFPFVQTVFAPGYNDRVSAQGGAGLRLQIDSNYIKNAYVSPSQQALNSLFGANIGWSSFYSMTVNSDANQQLSMVVKDYKGRQVASSLIGTGPDSTNHAIIPNTVPNAVFYTQDLLTPSSPNQVIDTLSGTRVADADYFNEVQSMDSLKYSCTFAPFPACPGQYISVKAHLNYTVTDQCGYLKLNKDTVLGVNGVTSATTINYNPSAFIFCDAAPYHVHKSLSFYPYDVDEAVNAFFSAANCFPTESSFIRESVSSVVSCPASSNVDSTPCDKMKWEMMQQLLPGGAYANTSKGLGNINSIFSTYCPADTIVLLKYDSSALHTCIMTAVGAGVDSEKHASGGWYWGRDIFDGTDFFADLDTCYKAADSLPITTTARVQLIADTSDDWVYAAGIGGKFSTTCHHIHTVSGSIHDLTGTHIIGSINTAFDGSWGELTYIYLPATIYPSDSIDINSIGILPTGDTIVLQLHTPPGYPYGRSTVVYPDSSYVDSVVAAGYGAGTCSFAPGLHYRYQDTCTVPSLPDTITVAGIFYNHLRTMSADSFIMVYNGAIAEGNYSIATALLPLHPQYCELQKCFNDTFKTQVSAIPNMRVAQALHLFYLDSLIAHDPIKILMSASGLFPSPSDSLRTFPGGIFRLDTFILMHAYCSCSDSVMFAQCATGMFSYEIAHRLLVNDAVKSYYFDHLASTYFANRHQYLDKILTQGGNTCGPCSLARMTINPGAVVTPSPYPIGFTMSANDSAFSGAGSSDWLAGVLRDSVSSIYDSALMARMHDTALALVHSSDSSLTYGAIDTIMARLSNCISGNAVLATAIRDSFITLYQAGAVSQGNFTPLQIRNVLRSNGVTFSDLCNPYLIDCFQFGTPSPIPVYDCLPQTFYADQSSFMNTSAVLGAVSSPGLSFTYSLDSNLNSFEKMIGRRLGNRSSTSIIAQYSSAKKLYEIDITSPGSSGTVRVNLHSPACGDIFSTSAGPFITTISCSNSSPSLATASGFIGEFSFIATVTAGSTTTCAMTGWTDSVQSMSYMNNAISQCVPCTQMRELYTRFNDTLASYGIFGTDHPYYETMLAKFMNSALQRMYSASDYETFIQSCALADSMLMPLYTGYATCTFGSSADMNSFISMLNSIDPDYSFDNDYRDSSLSSTGIITLCVNLNTVPATELYMYKNAVNTYSGPTITRAIDLPLSTLLPTGEIGFIYLPPSYAFSPSDSTFADTAKIIFNGPYPKKVWIAGQFVVQKFYDVIAKSSARPYHVSQAEYQLTTRISNIPGAVYIPAYMSTINSDYFKPEKKAYLKYTYGYQQYPSYAVIDSIQSQFLTARIPSYSGYSASYLQPFKPGAPTNLYLGSSGMNNRYYDTLKKIINLSGTAGGIFHAAKRTDISIPSPRKLTAYVCSDDTYWYRYFTTGDSLFNVYVSFPSYIPKYLRSSYRVVGSVIPVPCDSLNRSFLLNLVRTGSTDTIQAYGRTSFVIGNSVELDNVLLGNPLTETHVPQVPTFDNCETQALNSAINQGIVNYKNYIDSAKRSITSSFASYVARANVTESLTLGYMNDEFNYTLYNYDRAGNLASTVPPAGSVPIPNTGTLLNQVDTSRANNTPSLSPAPTYSKMNTYHYNTYNQVTEQAIPDAGTTRFFYDGAGRLVFLQNAKQALNGYYTYNIYDQQNRNIETGEVLLGGPPDPYDVQHLDQLPYDSVVKHIRAIYNRNDVVMTIYDTAALNLDTVNNTWLDRQQNLRNRISCVKYFVVLDSLDTTYTKYTHASHFSYDMEGNVQTLVQDFPNMENDVLFKSKKKRFKRIDYDYDLISGKVNMLSYNRGWPDQFYQRYSYDADNRITGVQTSADGYIWKQDAAYSYYDHGPLARVQLGDLAVQGIDYAYTIQGWLKAMNTDTLSNALDMGTDGLASSGSVVSKDAAAYAIDYFRGDYQPIGSKVVQHADLPTHSLFNGNISRQTEAIAGFQRLNKQYVYDQLNRIRRADYSAINPVTGTLTGITDFKSRYTYDDDGNLQSLVRYGNKTGSGAMLMDSLIYQYTSGSTDNKLRNIFDYAPNHYSNDIPNYTGPPVSRYQYDAIGNVTKDLVSGSDTVSWNLYNKPVEIQGYSNGNWLQFTYDAAGNRVEKTSHTYNPATFIETESRDYYIRDAQGNILAIYHDKYEFSTYTAYKHENFDLAEHDIYGTSRIGVQKYFPGQIGIECDIPAGAPVLGDTTHLYSHLPWYSLEYQDVIKTDSLNLYGNAHTDTCYVQSIRGQKQYEVADHLGNVLATVSDKRADDSLTGPHATGSLVSVETWKPIIVNAYDYYPFGEYMPGRWIGDTGMQCLTTTKPGLGPVGTPVFHPWAGSAPLPGPFVPFGGSYAPGSGTPGSCLTMTSSVAGDGFYYTIRGLRAGVPQNLTLYIEGTGIYYISILDSATGATVGTNAIAGVFTPRTLSVSFTPSASCVQLMLSTGAAGNLKIYGLYYDSISFVPMLVTSTVCNEDGYEYGYNGQMKVNEIAGAGNHEVFKAREYDSRTGRFWSVDPLFAKYPWNGAYNFAEDRVIDGKDLEGKEHMSMIMGPIMLMRPTPTPQTAEDVKNSQINLQGHPIDQRDVAPEASRFDYESNPMGAIVKDATNIVFTLIGINPIVKDVSILKDPNASVGEKAGALLDIGVSTSMGEGEANAGGEKTYQTYTKPDLNGGKPYSGKTSGRGTPEENVANRDENHHMNKRGYGPAQLDKSSLNPDAIRGREQQNIDANGGAQSTGGNSGNRRNSISPKNPNRQKYLDAAKKLE